MKMELEKWERKWTYKWENGESMGSGTVSEIGEIGMEMEMEMANINGNKNGKMKKNEKCKWSG